MKKDVTCIKIENNINHVIATTNRVSGIQRCNVFV